MFRGRRNSKSWHLFDLGGHRVEMEPWFLALVGFFSLIGVPTQSHDLISMVTNILIPVVTNIAIWAPILFVGVLFHEFGHALSMKFFGYGSSRIVLQAFGGVTINERRRQSPPGKSILISLAGPFASLLLAALFIGLLILYAGFINLFDATGGQHGLVARFLGTMGLINAVWAIFNLIPINPLDGGHVVLHSLRAAFGERRKAMRYTAMASLAVLGALVVVSLLVPIFDPIPFFLLAFMFGVQNYQIYKATGSGGPPGGVYRPR